MQSGTDWVACGQCHRWQHIACDPRSGLGDLKQFADSGKVFSCVDCSKIKAEQEQQAPDANANMGQIATGQPVQHEGLAAVRMGQQQQQQQPGMQQAGMMDHQQMGHMQHGHAM
jgi:hypothetical protein